MQMASQAPHVSGILSKKSTQNQALAHGLQLPSLCVLSSPTLALGPFPIPLLTAWQGRAQVTTYPPVEVFCDRPSWSL